MATLRRCAAAGCTLKTRARRPYCPTHARQREQARGPRSQYNAAWRRQSKAAIAAQPWCSVCGTTLDLTLDHSGVVLCRADNTRWRNLGISRTT